MSREIKYLIIHHSISPRDQTLDKSVRSFSTTHKNNLGQPATNLDLPEDMKYCAYHFVIAGDGSKMHTRDYDELGYHAGSLTYNRKSLGICLTGDFDTESPSDAQIETLKKLLKNLCREFDISAENVIGHCDVPGVIRTCPGSNMYDLLPNLRKSMENQPSSWATEAWEWGKENGIVSENSEPQKTVTKEELVVFLYRFYNSTK